MDGSRFDWELRGEDGEERLAGAVAVSRAEGAGAFGETGADFSERGGAPTTAWAPVLIWITLGVTIAISAAL